MFKGSGVAIVTPFDKNNNIDYDTYKKLIEFQIKNHTDAIIVCGTTGESATLNTDEKKELIKFTVKSVKGRLPVIAGTGSNNTDTAIELSKFAKKAGVNGLLLVTPYYNKCNQEGLYFHYKKIAESVDLPIILYNVPSRTGVNIELETLIKLAKIDNIVGIKEASGNISQILKIAYSLENKLQIYSGNDDQTLPILALGGSGVLSVAANIIPKQIHDLCYSFFDGNIELAKKIQYKYLELMNNLFIDVNPIPIKEAMNMLNLNVGNCRLPLYSMPLDKKEKLNKTIKNLNLKI